ncbi:hypothetical protein SNEBB_009349 [Seison nebaliae]|nr:hypothetical protein SNEBB_009349 [Seison nebaliae]
MVLDIMQAKRAMGGHKSTVTMLLNRIKDPETTYSKVAITQQLEQISQQLNLVQKYGAEVADAMLVSSDFNEEAFAKFQFTLSQYVADTRTTVEELSPLDSHSSSGSECSSNRLRRQTSHMKLPTLKLPEFDGKTTEWQSFADSFMSAIDSRTDLSNSEKLTYLKGQLRGPARRLVEAFSTTGNNYDTVVDLLKTTYGNPHRIKQTHVFKLLDLQQTSASHDSLVDFRSELEYHLRGLEALDVDLGSVDFVWVAIVIRKLPSEIVEQIYLKNGTDYPSLTQFRSALSEVISHQETKISKAPQAYVKSCKANTTPRPTTACSIDFSDIQQVRRDNRICLFCEEEHSAVRCSIYTSVSERVMRAKALKLCIKCLANYSFDHKCDLKFACRKCKQDHHLAMCPQISPNRVEEVTCNSVPHVHGYGSVALPSISLPIRSRGGADSMRALLDGCSQTTFVRSSEVARLKLKRVDKVRLVISGLDTKAEAKMYNVVQVPIVIGNKQLNLTAIEVSSIPSPAITPEIKRAANALKQLDVNLADNSLAGGRSSPIACLVGADHYFDIVLNHPIKLVRGIRLIPTKLGFAVTGNIPKRYCRNSHGTNNASDKVTLLKVAVGSDLSSSPDID